MLGLGVGTQVLVNNTVHYSTTIVILLLSPDHSQTDIRRRRQKDRSPTFLNGDNPPTFWLVSITRRMTTAVYFNPMTRIGGAAYSIILLKSLLQAYHSQYTVQLHRPLQEITQVSFGAECSNINICHASKVKYRTRLRRCHK